MANVLIKDPGKSLWSVNPKFLLIKVHYFLFNAGIASSITFGSTVAKQIGYTAVTVGFMYTCLPLLGLFAKILCGALADKYKLRKLCFFLAVFICLLCSFVMMFIPTISPAKKASMLCHDLTYINSCNNMVAGARIDDFMKTDPQSVIRCEVDCDLSTDTYNASKVWWSADLHKRLGFLAFLPKERIHSIGSCVYGEFHDAQIVGSNTTVIAVCKKDLHFECSVKCDDGRLASVLGEDRTIGDDFMQLNFWILFLIFALNWCGMAVTNSLSDTVCFDILANEPEKFGAQRMFGALGWGLMALSSGSLVDWFSGDSSDKNYKILYYVGCAVLCSDLYIILRLKVEHKVISVTVYRDVKVLFYNFRTVIFTVWCMLTGVLMGVSWQFLFWHLEDISKPEDLHWSKTLQGLDSLFTTVIGELPFFLIAGKIIKLCGYIHTMTVVLVACALRMFLYSNLPSPVWVLPVELISGFTFSMCYVLIASYSSLITIPGTETTVQGLFGAMFDGLGASLGGLIGGVIYYQHGGSTLFGLLAFICASAAIAHYILQRTLKPTPVYNAQSATNGDLSAHYASPNDAITILERS